MKNIFLPLPILKILNENDKNDIELTKIFKQFDKIYEELQEVIEETDKFKEIKKKFDENSNELNRFNLENTQINLIGELIDLIQATINLFVMFDLDEKLIKKSEFNHISKLINRRWETLGHVELFFWLKENMVKNE